MKLTPSIVLLIALLAFGWGLGASQVLFPRIVREVPEVQKYLDYQAGLYRNELISEGQRVINVSKPEGIQFLLEVNDWNAFKTLHKNYAPELPYTYFEEPMNDGYIPTFSFLYIAENYNWVVVFRVYRMET